MLMPGCGPRTIPEPPPPAPARPAEAPARPAVMPVDWDEPIRICVVRNGELTRIPVRYDPATGDTSSMDGLPFSSVAPITGEYAAVAGWYVNDEPITFRDRRYTKYRLPRVLGENEVTRVGEFRGVGVYVERADPSAETVIYLPTRSGCEFQPYLAAGRANDDG